MTTDDARLARLEEQVGGLREDAAEVKDELIRTRNRLHDLEGVSGLLVDQEKFRRQATAARQKTLERRISMLAVVVSVAALAEPFLYHVANGG